MIFVTLKSPLIPKLEHKPPGITDRKFTDYQNSYASFQQMNFLQSKENLSRLVSNSQFNPQLPPQIVILQAAIEHQRSSFSTALTLYQELAEEFNSNIDEEGIYHKDDIFSILYNYSIVQLDLGQYSKALGTIQRLQLKDDLTFNEKSKLDELQGIIFCGQCQFTKSVARLEEVIQSRKEQSPLEHFSLIDALVNLSIANRNSGEYTKPIYLLKEAQQILKGQLDSIKVQYYKLIVSINYSASLYYLGKFREAKYICQSCVEESKKFKDNDNGLLLAAAKNNFVFVLRNQTNQQSILDQAIQALKIHQQLFNQNHHPDTAIIYSNISLLLIKENRLDEALEKCNDCLNIRLKVFGTSDHLEVANIYHNIGLIWNYKQKNDDATEYFNKALNIYLKVVGDSHPDIAIIYNNIGWLYWSTKTNLHQGLINYMKGLQIRMKYSKQNDFEVSNTLLNVGELIHFKKDYVLCSKLLKQSYNINKKLLGEEFDIIQYIRRFLIDIENKEAIQNQNLKFEV